MRRLNENTAAAAEPRTGRVDAAKRRGARLARTAWANIRPTRNRSTGYIAIGAIGALIGTSVVVGVGAAGSLPHLADIGAWLGSSKKGEVAHGNGLTGDVDGKVALPNMDGHPVQVSQDGKSVLVLDSKTGKVVRIDPSQLTAEQSSDYGATGLQLISGGTASYLVDPGRGTVQQIDPILTTPIGSPVDLGGKLGVAAVDPQGTLWVPVPGSGQVVPVVGGQKSPGISVGKAGDTLDLTLANGLPVVTDASAAVMKVLSATGTQATFNLQGGMGNSDPAKILIPAQTDGSLVPVLASDSGALALVDVAAGQQTNVKITVGGHQLGAPQMLGQRVYIPDDTTGSLQVYNTNTAAFDAAIRVTGTPGALQIFVRNGLLWANDENNAAAAVINSNGTVQNIGKYKTDVPTARKPQEQNPVTNNVPTAPAQQTRAPVAPPVNNPAPPATHQPTTPTSSAPDCKVNWQAGCPQPMAPGTPQVSSGAGSITVTFAAASGTTPQNYTLSGVPAGASVTPNSVDAQGPFTFQVNGGSCSRTYSFTVVAHYSGGAGDKPSQPSAAVRPCAPPGPPNVQISLPQGGHGATVSWTGGGNGTMYTVSGPGGSTTTSGTSHSYTGLQNSQTYPVTVTATNAAGSAPSRATIDLTPPAQTMNIVHNQNDSTPLYIRTGPATSTGGRAGSFPSYYKGPVTVACKVVGESETQTYDKTTSNMWGKISSGYGSGYVADIYLDSRFNPNVWDCT